MELCGVCILTNDVAKLSEFYEFVLEEKSKGNDIHRSFDSSKLAIWNPGITSVAKVKSISLMYYVNDVDALHKKIKNSKFNVKIIEKPNGKPWGVRAIVFLDPDGNELNFLNSD